MADNKSTTAVVSMCAFGAKWLKPTRIEFFLSSTAAVTAQFAKMKCKSKRQKTKGKPTICQFSKEEHVLLSGLDGQKKGGFLTKAAQEYPRGLCIAIAKAHFGG